MNGIVVRSADNLRRVTSHGYKPLSLTVFVPLPFVALAHPQDADDIVLGVALVPVAHRDFFAER